MRNRLGVVLLTVVITALCLYYLSLSWVTSRVEDRATVHATDSVGEVSQILRQQYLDSIWNEPVFEGLGLSFSYKELKETELNLGLDLQGGMHVTVEVSPRGVVQALARNPQDSALNVALDAAQGSTGNYIDAFYTAYQATNAGALSGLFAHVKTQGKINANDDDATIIAVLKDEAEDVITRSFYILRARIDRFGTSQPSIQRLQNSGRIQIELPGVDNPARVRNLLRGIAELNFYEVATPNEVEASFSDINNWYVSTLPALDDSTDAGSSLEDLLSEDNSTDNSADSTTDSTIDSVETDPFDTDPFETDSFDSIDENLVEDSLDENLDENLDEALGTDSTLDEDAITGALDSARQDSTETEDLSSRVAPLFGLLKASDRLLYELKDTLQINRFLAQREVQQRLPKNLALRWSAQTSVQGNVEYLELFPLTIPTSQSTLSGDVVTNASPTFDQYGRPAISMQMNSNGAKKWRLLTRNNLGEQIAIVLDDRVYSAPVVEGEIANGSSQITGDFSVEDAKDLSNILKSGALPAPIEIVEDVVIGPTLGKLAQQQGFISIISGFVLVILFMMMYYAKGGFIANLVLAFNVFFILGILTQLNASLTLAGIAGIVLTIGMSIDANVLIFERIREELQSGTGIRQAVQQGYQRAYSSIIDANVTTFLTGGILFLLGQGPIKGFAVTLMVGIVCSLFTAVYLSRLIITWLLERNPNATVSFSTIFSRRLVLQPKIAWLSHKNKAYIGSAIFIGLGLIALVLKGGLNLGVDFVGGRSYIVHFNEAPSPSELKVGLTPYLENKSVEVKTFGDAQTLKITTNYLIDDNSNTADSLVANNIITGIADVTSLPYVTEATPDDGFYVASTVKVGATIADDIKNASTSAVLVALLAIFLYILVRFKYWQFGIGAIIALFHDVLIVLSAVAIAYALGISFEIDQIFIAAVLTLIGYSINDTVVIFDRVREQLNLTRSADQTTRFNTALNQTLSRTLITSTTTLLVVGVLLIFGGAVLRSFSFTLLIGIITGTYSSLFIATPSAVDLLRRSGPKGPSKGGQ